MIHRLRGFCEASSSDHAADMMHSSASLHEGPALKVSPYVTLLSHKALGEPRSRTSVGKVEDNCKFFPGLDGNTLIVFTLMEGTTMIRLDQMTRDPLTTYIQDPWCDTVLKRSTMRHSLN